MSFTMVVPTAVPSVFHSSDPAAIVEARKYQNPATFSMPPGAFAPPDPDRAAAGALSMGVAPTLLMSLTSVHFCAEAVAANAATPITAKILVSMAC